MTNESSAVAALRELPEPAAHMYPSDLERFQTSETFAQAFSVAVGNADERSVPLFSAEQMRAALSAAPVSPQGWVMVPQEPTQEMVDAVLNGIVKFHRSPEEDVAADYRAMIAAAPAALAVQPQQHPTDSLGASPCGGPGSAAYRPEPQSVSALRAPIPGAAGETPEQAVVRLGREMGEEIAKLRDGDLSGLDPELLKYARETLDALVARNEPLLALHKELNKFKWIGADKGWDLAIEAVRKHIEDVVGWLVMDHAKQPRARDQVRSTETAGLGPQGDEGEHE